MICSSLWLRALVLCVYACACATAKPPSGGMPTQLAWDAVANGGNCADMTRIDAHGTVTGSSGCESGAHNDAPRTLTPAEMARLVEALDRLRASPLWSAGDAEHGCSDGVVVRLVEASGARRQWAFCADPGSPKGPTLPQEMIDLHVALWPPAE